MSVSENGFTMLSVEFFSQLILSITVAFFCVGTIMLLVRQSRKTAFEKNTGHIAFLFDGAELIDATKPARALIRNSAAASPLEALVIMLAPRFPDMRKALRDISDVGEMRMFANDGDAGEVHLQFRNGITRIVLSGDAEDSAANISAKVTNHSITDEVDALRAMADSSPQLMWRQDIAGIITWANAAYVDFCERCQPDTVEIWPPQAIFDDLALPAEAEAARTTRHAVLPPDAEEPLWFDVTVQKSGRQHLFIAHDVTNHIRMEDMNRDVLQTLTKTFAGLSVGLAVFNKDKQLVLFNPALTELTSIRAVDLIGKPRLDTFFDQLREHGVLPEPRDYVAWRRHMTAIEEAAARGDFTERWDLADGKSLEVTGKPFPNGAFALFFQDQSQNTMQDHALHAAESVLMGALNASEKAIAIFSGDGTLRTSNIAYSQLWPTESGTIDGHLEEWRNNASNVNGWDALAEKSLNMSGPRLMFDSTLDDGSLLKISAHHLNDGSLLVSFKREQQHEEETLPASTEHSLRAING